MTTDKPKISMKRYEELVRAEMEKQYTALGVMDRYLAEAAVYEAYEVESCPDFHDCETCNPPSDQKPAPIKAAPTVVRRKRNVMTR